jgi:hypothetical protein
MVGPREHAHARHRLMGLIERSDEVGEDEGNLSRLESVHNPGTSESRPRVPVCSVGSARLPRLDGPDDVLLADAAARQANDAGHHEDCRIIGMPCGQLHLRGNLPQRTEPHTATLDQQTTGKRKAFSYEKKAFCRRKRAC